MARVKKAKTTTTKKKLQHTAALAAVRLKYAARMAVVAARMLEDAKTAMQIEEELRAECVAIAGERFESEYVVSFEPQAEYFGLEQDISAEDWSVDFGGVVGLAEHCVSLTTKLLLENNEGV